MANASYNDPMDGNPREPVKQAPSKENQGKMGVPGIGFGKLSKLERSSIKFPPVQEETKFEDIQP